MKIEKSKTKKSLYIAISIIAACVVVYLFCAYTFSLWPLQDNKPTSTSQQVKKEQNDEEVKDEVGDGNVDSSQDRPIEESPTSTDQDQDYLDSPVSNKPTNSDPYPITNEHYRIKQNSSTDYSITLYPIVNNPDYSDYNAQLKDYKQEALSYLRARYGSVDNFTINWSPGDAQNL